MPDLKSVVKECALELGFDLVRVTSAQEFAWDREVTLARLKDGLMDGLPWFNEDRVRRGADPESLLPGARSIICLGLSYHQPTGQVLDPGVPAGKVALYAWGNDYHRVMKSRMRQYVEELSGRLGVDIAARWYVDDGPMLDRAAAQRSGLGWFGKNTNILTSSHGSWVFLGQGITDLDLEPDTPLRKTCGSCVMCIDACPTGAIVAPYVIDNSRCISYLTIENRGPIPRELRPQMLDWVFGCDICQDVCPVNRKALTSKEPAFREPAFRQHAHGSLELVELLEMSEDEFRERFKGSPILRAKHTGLQRNACVALGNHGDAATVPALNRALCQGAMLVRGHAAWALGRIGTVEAKADLESARDLELDAEVLEEISAALAELVTSAAVSLE